MAFIHRRWEDTNPDVMFAVKDGVIYYVNMTDIASPQWNALQHPPDMPAYQTNVWSWVTYEMYDSINDQTVDVLLMSNPLDGMILINCHSFLVQKVLTPYKFGVIERHAERIWGTGIIDEPDKIVYSRPFNPLNWLKAGDDPEDPEGMQEEEGAGDIDQPSWDGDRFEALRSFGSQLIAFKKHRVWRVYGTDPGDFTFKEQYGGGAAFYNTIAVDGERILMVEEDGVSVYDGVSVNGYQRQAIEDFWKTVNKSAMNQMCAALFKNRYYIALPTGNSTVNNELLIFNLTDGTILRNTNVYIEAFLSTDDELYSTTSQLPGEIHLVKWDSWKTGKATENATKWVTPWMDFGYKKIKKGSYDIYFTPEVQDDPVTLSFSVQTERKTKTKKYTVMPLTATEKAAGKQHKQKRLHFGGSGRRFRLIIETEAGSDAPWRLIGGIQMIVDTDPD